MSSNLENSSVDAAVVDSLFEMICNSDNGILDELRTKSVASRHMLTEAFVLPRIRMMEHLDLKTKRVKDAQIYFYSHIRLPLHARLHLEKGINYS